MTLQQLMTLYAEKPAVVRVLFGRGICGERLFTRQSLTRGKIGVHRGYTQTVVTAHPDTWAELQAEAAPLREAFARAVGWERGGAA